MDLKIGYKASAEQFGPRRLVELGVLAEQHGFDTVTVSDHYQPWRHEGGHAPFSLAWMSAVGERTERVLLGTSVLTPTFRYHPAVIAQAFATMGCLFPGRVMLGVGTGEAMNEVAVTGIEWPEFKERFARMREAVRLIRALWSDERVTFEGDYYKTDDATVYDRPEHAGADLHRRRRAAGRALRRPRRRRLHLHERQGHGALHREAAARGRRGPREGRPRRRHRPHDRDQALLRPGPAARAREHALLGAARADRRAEGRARGPDRDAARRRRAPDRAGREPLDRRLRPRRRDRARSSPTSTPASPTSSSTRPGEDQERFLSAFEEQVAPGLRAL